MQDGSGQQHRRNRAHFVGQDLVHAAALDAHDDAEARRDADNAPKFEQLDRTGKAWQTKALAGGGGA